MTPTSSWQTQCLTAMRLGLVHQRATKQELSFVHCQTAAEDSPIGTIAIWERGVPVPDGWKEHEHQIEDCQFTWDASANPVALVPGMIIERYA